MPWIDPATSVEWLRPYVEAARVHAFDLATDLGDEQSPTANAVCEELASARMIYRAQLALAASGDRKALAEARAWLKESRSHALALEGLRRNAGKSAEDDWDRQQEIELRAQQLNFQRQLADGRAGRARTPDAPDEPEPSEPHEQSDDDPSEPHEP